jgi:hypothetical protein
MAIDTSVFATDLAGMIADLPCVAKWGSTTFNCAASELSTEESLILTGNNTINAIRIFFPVTAFTVDATFKPQARLQLKFPDTSAFTNYEIVTISKSPDAVAYEVILKNDNRTI